MVYRVVFLVLLPCFVLVHFSGCFPLVLYFLPFLTTPVLCSPNCPAPLQVSTHRSGPVPHVSPQPPLMFSIWCVFRFCSLLGSCLCLGLFYESYVWLDSFIFCLLPYLFLLLLELFFVIGISGILSSLFGLLFSIKLLILPLHTFSVLYPLPL